ncbi:XRE family transcriptional regulator [Pedobacter agri]|uniref:XRE family transcriptional regulator n=1 Tax=Pedobacter agri TaxID=454586 RepID=UPI002930A46B|nr:helix-turn-helix transcriptional regulator [Pedobacter agri]
MLDYQGKKFKEFVTRRGLSIVRIADELGVSRNTIYQYFKSDSLQRDTVNNIITKLNTTVDEIWGEGHSPSARLEAIPRFVYPDPEFFEGNDHKYAYTEEGIVAMRVKIVPAKAQLGYFRGYADPEYLDQFDYEIINVDKEHFGNYNGFETVGYSMVNLTSEAWAEKSIFPNRYAIGREVDRVHWKNQLHIHSNDAWVIVHRTEGVILKEIIKHDKDNGIITVHSWNPDKDTYPDEDLFLGDVAQIFNVVKIIDRRR